MYDYNLLVKAIDLRSLRA